MTKYRQNRFFWLIAIIGLILDQLSKYLVRHSFAELGDTIPIWQDIFHLTYVINTGAAFSFFSDQVRLLRWLSLIFSLGLMTFAYLYPIRRKEIQFGLGFILAGALGNGIDRFLFGYVVDFIDFRNNQAIINFADVFIELGILFLILTFFRRLSKI